MCRKLKYLFEQELKGKLDNIILWLFQSQLNNTVITYPYQGTTQSINNNPIPDFSTQNESVSQQLF
jgi:hypothetical protein